MQSFPSTCLRLCAVLGALAATTGCAPSPFTFDAPESRPLLRELPKYRAPADPSYENPIAELEALTDDLTLRSALSAALLRNPRLQAAAWQPRLAEAQRLQAGLSPNPEVGIEFENFAGSGDLSGTDALETTLVLSQLIELGSKRKLRVQVAEGAWSVSALDYEAVRLEVLSETAGRYVRVLELQQRVEYAERARSLAEESRRVIERRVEAGDVSPIDEIKARLESESARITADRLKRDLTAARRELSAMWDESEPKFELALGSLDEIMDVPSIQTLTDRVESHPEVQRWVAEGDRRESTIELERARATSDVTVGLGVRYINEVDEGALVGGISMPLILFDRNQGGILAARMGVAQAIDEGRASYRNLATRLVREHASLTAAFHEAQAIESVLLPAARDAFTATRRAYDEGKLPYLDVLDAQRTLFETESQRLEVLAEYHSAMVQVESLISEPLNTSPGLSGQHGDTP